MEKVMYSIVIPVYNSKSTLEELFARIHAVFVGIRNIFEVIFEKD